MRKPELLAPAGGPQQFKAAVSAGADAVYLGGSLFNARIGAGNFTLEEMQEAVDYGHLRGVKTYVTLNTLMDDKDVPKAVSYASKLYEMGVDALIIQDFGLGYAIREALPGMEIHLSTQATIADPRGVAAARKMGYKRTVLSRELSLPEIRACSEAGETEVFIHGALCICYSGQCQLSRYIGGRSGNKGLCAQPCRLAYSYRTDDGKDLGNAAHLSPKDLCLIDRIGDLIDCGVASFKIEGRMKSPEYVATVVSIYRKYIDKYLKDGKYTVSPEDRTALLQAFNRDGFTEGYIDGDPGKDLMTHGISKNTGIFAGTVSGVRKNSPLVDIIPACDIRMHDVLEIHGDIDSSFRVTYLEKLKGGDLRVGDLKVPASRGTKVYRLISRDLTDKAAAIISSEKRVPADMFFLARADLNMKLTVKDPNSGISVTVTSEEPVQPSLKASATEESVMRQLRKTGDTPFVINKADILLDPGLFIPVSVLNALRRKALDELEKKITDAFRHESTGYTLPDPYAPEAKCLSTVFDADDHAVILPQVTRGPFDEYLETHYANLASKANRGGSSVVVSSISWIGPINEAGARVIGGPGLNITNSYAVKALREIGMSEEYVQSPEFLESGEMDGVPLIITEHPMEPGTLKDRKGAQYRVEYDETTHKSYIFSK